MDSRGGITPRRAGQRSRRPAPLRAGVRIPGFPRRWLHPHSPRNKAAVNFEKKQPALPSVPHQNLLDEQVGALPEFHAPFLRLRSEPGGRSAIPSWDSGLPIFG